MVFRPIGTKRSLFGNGHGNYNCSNSGWGCGIENNAYDGYGCDFTISSSYWDEEDEAWFNATDNGLGDGNLIQYGNGSGHSTVSVKLRR